MSRREHWEQVYSGKPPDRLGWYKPRLQTSLTWIDAMKLGPDAPIIDVGAGASTLVDDLLGRGHSHITLLDIAAPALDLIKARLGERGEDLTWLCGDVTDVELPADAYLLWHDRAVFHFLTEPADRARYLENLSRSLRPGGHVILGTFAPEAPPMCSGLPVQRYDLDLLQETLGDNYRCLRNQNELHVTPGGVEQMYLYCQFRREG
jgi:SAM-dependent methyltransferase